MYYGRRTIIRSDDLSDTQKLRKWVFSLTEHSMYGTIVSDLMSMPGFVHKLSTVKETTAGQVFINEVAVAKEYADLIKARGGQVALFLTPAYEPPHARYRTQAASLQGAAPRRERILSGRFEQCRCA